MAVPLRVAVRPCVYHLEHCLSYVMLVHIHTGQNLKLKLHWYRMLIWKCSCMCRQVVGCLWRGSWSVSWYCSSQHRRNTLYSSLTSLQRTFARDFRIPPSCKILSSLFWDVTQLRLPVVTDVWGQPVDLMVRGQAVFLDCSRLGRWGPTSCPETSLITNLGCATSEKNEDLSLFFTMMSSLFCWRLYMHHWMSVMYIKPEYFETLRQVLSSLAFPSVSIGWIIDWLAVVVWYHCRWWYEVG